MNEVPKSSVELARDIDEADPFGEDAVYECLGDVEMPDTSVWQD